MAGIKIYERQALLLGWLYFLSKPVGRHTLQLFAFYNLLYGIGSHYSFLPTLKGPYSLRLEADVNFLLKNNLLQEKENCLKTRQSFHQGTLDRITLQKSRQLGQVFNDLPVNWIDKLYAHYKEYWLNKQSRDIQSDKYMLITLGYEGLTVEAYFQQIVAHKVNVLSDIRKNPFSRKFGFTKSTLEKGCELTGIRYQHLPELGIPKAMRSDIKTANERRALLDTYEYEMLPGQLSAIYYLQQLLVREGPLALLCYEKDPQKCHRSRLAKYLSKLFGETLNVKHIESG